MKMKEIMKRISLMGAGILMLMLAVGSPLNTREINKARHLARLQAQTIIEKCVPGTQMQIPGLPDKISFVCFLDAKSGLLDNLGPVRLLKNKKNDKQP